ncbi:hypothetical protein JTB14_015970 [Gonioctena quinquepunctata]|nr:hypothetical protein JTB14_015970 [Gonioctena quinquepunctata]
MKTKENIIKKSPEIRLVDEGQQFPDMRQKNYQENESSHTGYFNNDENRKAIQNNVEEGITGTYNLRKRENILAPEKFVNLAEAVALIAENNEPISFEEAIVSRDRKEFVLKFWWIDFDIHFLSSFPDTLT